MVAWQWTLEIAKDTPAARIYMSRRPDLSFPHPTHPPFGRFFNDVQTGDSTFTAGTRTTVAGSIIIVFAEFFLIFLIGLHDEEASWESGFKGEWTLLGSCFCMCVGGVRLCAVKNAFACAEGNRLPPRVSIMHYSSITTSKLHQFLIIILYTLASPTAAARAASKPPKDETPSGRAYATSAFEARGSPPTSRPQSPPTSQA